jgi:hypothetical protein
MLLTQGHRAREKKNGMQTTQISFKDSTPYHHLSLETGLVTRETADSKLYFNKQKLVPYSRYLNNFNKDLKYIPVAKLQRYCIYLNIFVYIYRYDI